MDQSRFIAKHVVNLPKSGIRDFFDIVAKMKAPSHSAWESQLLRVNNALHESRV